MSDLLSATDIETRAKAAGLSIGDICKRADIALSTFYRWKAGKTNPSIEVYRRLCEVTEPAQAA